MNPIRETEKLVDDTNTKGDYSTISLDEGNVSNIRRRGRSIVANIQAATDGFAAGFQQFNQSRETIKLCISIMVIYTVACAIGFFFWDHWSIIDSMYFVVVTFTTCGYGDLYPKDDLQRLCTCFFILFGVAVVGGYTLSTISDTVINMYASRVKKESKSSNLSLIGRFRSQSLRNSIDDEQIQTDQTDSLADDIKTVLGDLAPFLLFIFMCAIYIGSVEGWSIITSIYFCVVTATSVGYGDVVPETDSMKLFAVFFIPLSVGLMATTFGQLTSIVLAHKAAAAEKEFLNRRMTEADFEIMDVDKSGTVDYEEFVTFMLVAMGKVDHEDMLELKDTFNHLCSGGDSVQLQDLKGQIHRNGEDSDA